MVTKQDIRIVYQPSNLSKLGGVVLKSKSKQIKLPKLRKRGR